MYIIFPELIIGTVQCILYSFCLLQLYRVLTIGHSWYFNAGKLYLKTNSYILPNGSYVPREVTVTVNSMDPLPLVTITCITYGGPATIVTWTRDSEVIEGGITVLESGASARYRHTLYNATEGVYTCTVWNNKPSVVTAEVNVAGT